MNDVVTGDRATALTEIVARPDVPLTPDHAAEVLGDLGFLVVPSVPGRATRAYLLVALRDRPTFAHYDPESVLLWTHEGLHDAPTVLDRTTPLPFRTRFSWGAVRISDRVGATNEYLAFGGDIHMARVDGMRVVVIATPGPMLRRGGHSQGWDAGAAHLDGYFARLRAHIGDDRDLESLVVTMPPRARYAGYLTGAIGGFAESPTLAADRHQDLRHLRAEADRIRHDHPTDWAAGLRLLDALHGPDPDTGATADDQDSLIGAPDALLV
ncbi:MAG: hypothetical protein KF809_12640 [Chloroflexi bacterium]|nr:hypothetical protein [Chloroflexota bacterium]